MKTKLPLLFDLVFLFAATFLTVLALSEWMMPRAAGFAISFLAAFAAVLIAYRVKTRRERRYDLKKKDEQAAIALVDQLNYNTLQDNLRLLAAAAAKRNIKVTKGTNALRFPEQNAVLFPLFSFDGATRAQLALAHAQLREEETAIVASGAFSPELKAFAEKFGGRVLLLDGAALYTKLKEADALPPITIQLKPKKRTARELCRLMFLKSAARGYFTAGAMLLILSLIVPYRLYYVISGTVLTLYSVFLRFFGRSADERL